MFKNCSFTKWPQAISCNIQLNASHVFRFHSFVIIQPCVSESGEPRPIFACDSLSLSHQGMHCNSVGFVPICLKQVCLIYVFNGVPSFVDVGLYMSAIYHHGRHYEEVFDQSVIKPFSPDVQRQHLVLHLPGTKWELLSLTPSSVRSHLSSSSKSVTTG